MALLTTKNRKLCKEEIYFKKANRYCFPFMYLMWLSPDDVDLLGWTMYWAIIKADVVFLIKRQLCWINSPLVISHQQHYWGNLLYNTLLGSDINVFMFWLQKVVYILPTRWRVMFHRDLLETGMSYSTQEHTTES